MKKILSALLLCSGSLSAMADEVPGISIALENGSVVSYPTSKILNITYQGDNMVLSFADTNQQTIRVDDIKTMSLVNVPSTGSETKVENVQQTVIDNANIIYNIGTLKFKSQDGKTIKVK